MVDEIAKTITIRIPPCPSLTSYSYRYFFQNEKHVDRIGNEFVLIFMIESTLYFAEDGEDIQVDSGEWYIQKPGLKQEGRKGSPAPVYFYIHFSAYLFEDEKVNIKGESPCILLPIQGKFNINYIKPLLDKLISLLNQYPPNPLEKQSIFLDILKYLTTTENPASNGPTDISAKVMQYLKENYTKDIKCNDLTNRFHFTEDYLIRKMKKLCGITPGQYILFLRIERAKELLGSTDYKLSIIANVVGFNDLSVFYKAFRKQTGTSPGNWRKTSRNLHL